MSERVIVESPAVQAPVSKPGSAGAYDPALGDLVAVRDAEGRWLRKVALSRIMNGRDFAVVWVDWEGDEPSDGGVPWPCEDVRPLTEHPDALTAAEFRG